METKVISEQHLVSYYERFGWTVEKIISSPLVDNEKTLTYRLIRDLSDAQTAQITPLEKRAEKLVSIDKKWQGRFDQYWLNNVLVFITGIIIFFIVATHHQFFETDQFTFAFIRDVLIWTVVDYLVLYLSFFALKLLVKSQLKKRFNAILLKVKDILN